MNKSNVGMAITTDLGTQNLFILEEKRVGDRLALWALNKDYNFKDLVHSGPIINQLILRTEKHWFLLIMLIRGYIVQMIKLNILK